MILIFVIEFCLLTGVMVFAYTQILKPLWLDRPMFPLVHREERLALELHNAKRKEKEAVVEHEIDSIEARAERIRKGEEC